MNFSQEIYLTPEQVAQKLQLSVTTIYNLIKAQEMPAVRLGKCYRIAQSALAQRLGVNQSVTPPVVANFIEQLRASALATIIDDVLLFGSHARREASKESDIDVLVVLKSLSAIQREKLLQCEEDADAESGYESAMEVIKLTRAQWATQRREQTGLYRSIEKDGISLWQ